MKTKYFIIKNIIIKKKNQKNLNTIFYTKKYNIDLKIKTVN